MSADHPLRTYEATTLPKVCRAPQADIRVGARSGLRPCTDFISGASAQHPEI